jgi:hypothetical protein
MIGWQHFPAKLALALGSNYSLSVYAVYKSPHGKHFCRRVQHDDLLKERADANYPCMRHPYV